MLMTQNRNKLLSHFIGHAVTTIVHRILAQATLDVSLKEKYSKEIENSLSTSVFYREKINPSHQFQASEAYDVRSQIIQRVHSELLRRIGLGYKNVNLSLVESFIDTLLKEMNIA